jgi:hypothetical protein
MDIIIKLLAYVVFVLGSLYFYFGGTRKTKNKGSFNLIMIASVLLLSYYYWFRI